MVDAAYRFCAGHEAVSTVLTGTNSIAHLEENVQSVLSPPLPEGDVSRLGQLFQGVAQPIGN